MDRHDTVTRHLVGAGAGDLASLGRLFDDIAARVLAVARSITRDPRRAEDVTCEVMRRIWRQSPRFDPTSDDADRWIRQVVREVVATLPRDAVTAR